MELKYVIYCCLIFSLVRVEAAKLDICSRKPSITGLCAGATLGIFYDVETARCKYMGCSTGKRLFESLENCEKICNGRRHQRRVASTA